MAVYYALLAFCAARCGGRSVRAVTVPALALLAVTVARSATFSTELIGPEYATMLPDPGCRVTIADRNRNSTFSCNPHAPDAGSAHGIEIIGGIQKGDEKNRCIPVQFHPAVKEDWYGTGRELCCGILYRNED